VQLPPVAPVSFSRPSPAGANVLMLLSVTYRSSFALAQAYSQCSGSARTSIQSLLFCTTQSGTGFRR
jgi:hypothetical protein